MTKGQVALGLLVLPHLPDRSNSDKAQFSAG